MRDRMVCPVCATECGHISTDGGATWSCDVCYGVHDGGDD